MPYQPGPSKPPAQPVSRFNPGAPPAAPFNKFAPGPSTGEPQNGSGGVAATTGDGKQVDVTDPTGGGNWQPASVPPAGTPAAPAGSNYFTAQALPGDFNMQWGGAGEQFFANTQGQYQSPSMAESVFAGSAAQLGQQGQGVQGAYAAIPGMTANGAGENWYARNGATGTQHSGGSNMAAQVFNDYQATAGAPGLDKYYENASRQALERVNQNAAARGNYGSSAALAEGNEMLTNLAADQAKNEANYNLDRLRTGSGIAQGAEASQRGWFDSAGNQAFRADEADLARQLSGAKMGLEADRADIDRLSTASDMAGQADQSWMNRLNSGQNAATSAQTSRENRIDQLFKAIFGTGESVANFSAEQFGQMLQDQLGIQTNANNASLGGPATALNYDTYEANQHAKEYSDWMDMFTFGQGGSGGPGGGGGGP